MNDDELRRSAKAERRRIVESTDIDRALAEVRARIESGAHVLPHPAGDSRPSRRWLVWAAAAATLAVVVAGVVVATRSDDDTTIRTVDLPPPTDSSAPTSLDQPVTTARADPTTTVAPTATDVPPETTASSVLPTQTIAVSYDNPPPLVEPKVIASIPLEPNPNRSPISVAIDDNEIAVSQPDTALVTLVGYEVGAGVETSRRTVDGAESLYSTVLGPDDVLYGFGDIALVEGSAVPDFRFVALALSGDRQGQVVAERRFSAVEYTELGPGAFGLGLGEVIDRTRNIGEAMIGYVDATGAPTTWTGEPPPMIVSEWGADGRSQSIAVLGAGPAWNLAITPDPNNGGDYVGPIPPAPTSGGRVIYSDNIGRDLTPGVDFGPSAMPVVAILEPDGTGRWVRLPDEWSVVSSDVWGTVLARTTDTALELALLDDMVPPG